MALCSTGFPANIVENQAQHWPRLCKPMKPCQLREIIITRINLEDLLQWKHGHNPLTPPKAVVFLDWIMLAATIYCFGLTNDTRNPQYRLLAADGRRVNSVESKLVMQPALQFISGTLTSRSHWRWCEERARVDKNCIGNDRLCLASEFITLRFVMDDSRERPISRRGDVGDICHVPALLQRCERTVGEDRPVSANFGDTISADAARQTARRHHLKFL